ncbi:hypothetical protein KCU83_g621, partial [Aureobasidium melanogenum]
MTSFQQAFSFAAGRVLNSAESLRVRSEGLWDCRTPVVKISMENGISSSTLHAPSRCRTTMKADKGAEGSWLNSVSLQHPQGRRR